MGSILLNILEQRHWQVLLIYNDLAVRHVNEAADIFILFQLSDIYISYAFFDYVILMYLLRHYIRHLFSINLFMSSDTNSK